MLITVSPIFIDRNAANLWMNYKNSLKLVGLAYSFAWRNWFQSWSDSVLELIIVKRVDTKCFSCYDWLPWLMFISYGLFIAQLLLSHTLTLPSRLIPKLLAVLPIIRYLTLMAPSCLNKSLNPLKAALKIANEFLGCIEERLSNLYGILSVTTSYLFHPVQTARPGVLPANTISNTCIYNPNEMFVVVLHSESIFALEVCVSIMHHRIFLVLLSAWRGVDLVVYLARHLFGVLGWVLSVRLVASH